MKDPNFREPFVRDLNALMRRLEYMVVACAIRKDEHLTRYGVAALDPYFLSLDILWSNASASKSERSLAVAS